MRGGFSLVNDQNTEEIQEKTVDDKRRENENYFVQLTSKNSDYMVKLNRMLDEEYNLDEETRIEVFNDMYPVIIDEQKKSVPAKKVYGTVTERAQAIIQDPYAGREQVVERSETWKLYLDGALLLGGMFALISGVAYLIGNEASGLGLVTMILNYILGGAAMLVINKYAPVPGQKGGFFKYIIATTLTLAVWIMLMSFGEVLVPSVLNPFIPGSITLVIGAGSLALKWYLKKKLNIRGTIM